MLFISPPPLHTSPFCMNCFPILHEFYLNLLSPFIFSLSFFFFHIFLFIFLISPPPECQRLVSPPTSWVGGKGYFLSNIWTVDPCSLYCTYEYMHWGPRTWSTLNRIRIWPASTGIDQTGIRKSGHSIVQYRYILRKSAENCNKCFVNCKFCAKWFKISVLLLLSDPDQTGPFPDPAMPDLDPYPSWSAVGALFHATLETSLFEQINDMENIVESLCCRRWPQSWYWSRSPRTWLLSSPPSHRYSDSPSYCRVVDSDHFLMDPFSLRHRSGY